MTIFWIIIMNIGTQNLMKSKHFYLILNYAINSFDIMMDVL